MLPWDWLSRFYSSREFKCFISCSMKLLFPRPKFLLKNEPFDSKQAWQPSVEETVDTVQDAAQTGRRGGSGRPRLENDPSFTRPVK